MVVIVSVKEVFIPLEQRGLNSSLLCSPSGLILKRSAQISLYQCKLTHELDNISLALSYANG